jgi:hypothetical protein
MVFPVGIDFASLLAESPFKDIFETIGDTGLCLGNSFEYWAII